MEKSKINIGITGTGSLVGQAIIKAARASAFNNAAHIVGFDYIPGTVGAKWVDKTFLLPDFLKKDASPEQWVQKLIDIIIQEKLSIIFIGIDFELELFAKYKDFIFSKTGCRVMVSDAEVISIANDKFLTYKFLKDNSFYCPKTALADRFNEADFSFPCVVKPRTGTSSKDVFIANNIDELRAQSRNIKDPLVQEYIGTEAREYTCGIIYFDNKVCQSIVLRRDIRDGDTVMAYFNDEIPEIIYDYISSVASKLKPFGACNFQLRLDGTGKPKIFEINARHSGTTYMRALFGFNSVEYIIAHLKGQQPPEFSLRKGTVRRFYNKAEKFYDEAFTHAE